MPLFILCCSFLINFAVAWSQDLIGQSDSPASELINYLHKYKLAYNVDWDESHFQNAFNKAVAHIETLTQQEATELFYQLKEDLRLAEFEDRSYFLGPILGFLASAFFFIPIVYFGRLEGGRGRVRDDCLAYNVLAFTIFVAVSLQLLVSEIKRKNDHLYPGKSYFDAPVAYYRPLLTKLIEKAGLAESELAFAAPEIGDW